MTFHVIPWMWGVDGDKTCGISDTIHITADGCESFFTLDRDFTVKPEQGQKKLAKLEQVAQKNSDEEFGDKPKTAKNTK
jgi:Xaa-Pro dipeptidase